ncbi:MAG: hypothetical protein QM742_15845 [Aquabacterium sp.]
MKRIWRGAGLAAVVILLVWSGWRMRAPAPHAGRPGSDMAAAAPHTDSPAMTPEQVRSRLFEQGSLSGTVPPGSWCVQEGALSPCAELRKRFEYYLLALGDVQIGEIRRLIAQDAARDHGEKLAADILAVWDRYDRLRTWPWQHKFEPSDRSTWEPALQEQRKVRRQVLGEAWA